MSGPTDFSRNAWENEVPQRLGLHFKKGKGDGVAVSMLLLLGGSDDFCRHVTLAAVKAGGDQYLSCSYQGLMSFPL